MGETTPAFVCASVAVCSVLAPVPSALSFCYLNDSDDMSEAQFTRSCHVLSVNRGIFWPAPCLSGFILEGVL